MSQIYGMLKPLWLTWKSESQAKLTGHFSLVIGVIGSPM
jgi:hypothetical protein